MTTNEGSPLDGVPIDRRRALKSVLIASAVSVPVITSVALGGRGSLAQAVDQSGAPTETDEPLITTTEEPVPSTTWTAPPTQPTAET